MTTELIHDAANQCQLMDNPTAWKWLLQFFLDQSMPHKLARQSRDDAWQLRRALLSSTAAATDPAVDTPSPCLPDAPAQAPATASDNLPPEPPKLAGDAAASVPVGVEPLPDLTPAPPPRPSGMIGFLGAGDGRYNGIQHVWVPGF